MKFNKGNFFKKLFTRRAAVTASIINSHDEYIASFGNPVTNPVIWTSPNFVNHQHVSIGPSTVTVNIPPTSGWVQFAFGTDPQLFRNFLKFIDGKVLMCTDFIEEETFPVQKDYALRYAYQMLKGKYSDTDVTAFHALDDTDEIQSLSFQTPTTDEQRAQALIYNEDEVNAFITRKEEEDKENGLSTTTVNNQGTLIGFNGVLASGISPFGFSSTSGTTFTTTGNFTITQQP